MPLPFGKNLREADADRVPLKDNHIRRAALQQLIYFQPIALAPTWGAAHRLVANKRRRTHLKCVRATESTRLSLASRCATPMRPHSMPQSVGTPFTVAEIA